ncbi:zinc transport system substrate-binding protein [Paenibacillus shirakamiensis]|uniref:Zinc transport system substrate-binding protein n=1 Tax=Paenibacillus shirakamiensis TaxID=1265935 RepID=A0ABS4JCF9_9BACL|nr:zinc ABC transporter substrate-binding protein [Paenibacillus shirakamiensis]MBP1999413.1 zinc transport system substrate-binding protein [Paenibacillus shirakamiensis]
MKRYIKLGVSFIAVLFVLTGCGQQENTIVAGKLNVVTSFYPIYEFAASIGGEDAHVTNLLPTGVEPHEWTPRSKDLINTSKAQLFLYNGAGLEGWVPNFVKGFNKDAVVKPVEVSSGIPLLYANDEEGEPSHSSSKEDQTGDDHHTDPHTWVSPKSALLMIKNIKDSYVAADPLHKANYEARYSGLAQKLRDLDHQFESALSTTVNKEIVVSHQAFGYLCRDYGLTQYAIMGLSPDAEPRAQDIIKLTHTVKDKKIKYIFFEEMVSKNLANTLAGETGVKTLVLSPVEGLTQEQVKNKDNYFTLMQRNLNNLLLALE